jgi:hypothetical protein
MAMQGTRADMLGEQFMTISGLLRDTIVGVPDEKWQAPTSGDGRQVNVVAHHAAGAHAYIARRIQAMADGQPQRVLIGHPREHTATIQATLAT